MAIVKPVKKQYKKKSLVKKRGMLTFSSVQKQISTALMRSAEKKRNDFVVYDQVVGQVNANGSGYLSLDITPAIIQGTSHGQRVGNKISLKSIHITTQLTEQGSSTQMAGNFSYMVINQKQVNQMDEYTTGHPSNPIEAMFNATKFIRSSTGTETDVIDSNAHRNQREYKNFEVLVEKKFYLSPDQIAGTSNRIVNKEFGFKFKTPMAMQYQNTTNESENNRIILLIRCSAGNIGSSSTLIGLPTGGAYTGYKFSVEANTYYTDL